MKNLMSVKFVRRASLKVKVWFIPAKNLNSAKFAKRDSMYVDTWIATKGFFPVKNPMTAIFVKRAVEIHTVH